MAIVRLSLYAGIFFAAAVVLRLTVVVLHGTALSEALSWRGIADVAPTHEVLIGLALTAAALLLELAVVGWQRSSLRQLAIGSAAGRPHADFVFLAMAATGFQAALASIATLGLWDVLARLMADKTMAGPLAGLPAWQAAPLLFLAMTFGNYWAHRLNHSKLLWPLHAIHHAAPSFTIANGARNGIGDHFLVGLSQGTAAALSGASPEALYWVFLVGSMETLYTHCNVRGLSWLERFGINSPMGHRLHHARDPRFFNRNFGDLLCVWDRLFGTYAPSGGVVDIEVGIDDPTGLHDASRPARAYLVPHWLWLKGLGAFAVGGRAQRSAGAA